MNAIELHHGARTDVGLVREANEDAYLAAPPVFVVADGMGGHEGGDVASTIVVEEFGRLAEAGYDPRAGVETVAAVLRTCQERIAAYAVTQRAHGIDRRLHAGTTAVVALLVETDDGPQWLLANVGDSRVYRFTDGVLAQVSVDHSLVQELVDAGTITEQDASVHPERNVITRALGNAEAVDADYFLLPAPAVQRLLLCTDGVSGLIDDEEIAQVLAASDDPRDAADQLVTAALAAGGTDNATAVVVDARSGS